MLSDLDQAGFIRQPHTSAGRVPTEAGFRLFVDALAKVGQLTQEQRESVQEGLKQCGEQGGLLRATGQLLSSLTGTAALVAAPRLDTETLADIRFMHMPDGSFLAVIIAQSGTVQNRIIRLDSLVDEAELERLHNYLRPHIHGRSLQQLRDHIAALVDAERGQYEALRRGAVQLLQSTMEVSPAVEIIVEGQQRLLDWPEFDDAEKIRSFMHAFEEKDRIVALLERALEARGVSVLIGSETELDAMEGISLVSANFRASGESAGALGVLGPQRMDYAKVMPLVGFTAEALTELLARKSSGKDEGRGNG